MNDVKKRIAYTYNASKSRRKMAKIIVDENYRPSSTFANRPLEDKLKMLKMVDYTKGLYRNDIRIDKISGSDYDAGAVRFLMSAMTDKERTQLNEIANDDYYGGKLSNKRLLEYIASSPTFKGGYKEYDKMMKMYKYWYHEYELVKTGQAIDIRLQQFKENYIKSLENSNIPKDIIKALRKTSAEKIYVKTIEPRIGTDTLDYSAFPKISDWYTINFVQGDWYDEAVEQMRSELGVTEYQRNIENKDYGSVYRAVGYSRDMGSFDANMELLINLRGVYIRNTNTYYIPFVGSDKGKNKFIADWIRKNKSDYQWRNVETYKDIWKK